METEIINKSKLYKVLRVLCLLPIILWPIIFFGTIFMFDDPNNNQTLMFLVFLGINAYPLYLIGLVVFSNRLYNKSILFASLILLIPPVFFGSLILYIYLN